MNPNSRRNELMFAYSNHEYAKNGQYHPTFYWSEGYDAGAADERKRAEGLAASVRETLALIKHGLSHSYLGAGQLEASLREWEAGK